MSIISIFQSIRDKPYRIPLSIDEEDLCCNGKHVVLKNLLAEQGYKVRYRICSFSWSSMNLPSKITNISHGDNATHLFIEVMIDGEWIIVDASWDAKLKNTFHINEWDGKSNTEIGVNPIAIFTPEKSAEIMRDDDEASILKDLATNGEFYKAFNDWLDEIRREFASE